MVAEPLAEARKAHEQVFIAKRPHECSACGKEIPAGRRYVRVVESINNKFHMKRFHLRCKP